MSLAPDTYEHDVDPDGVLVPRAKRRRPVTKQEVLAVAPKPNRAIGDKARIAHARSFHWLNLATEWDARAKDLETMYRDADGAADARAIATSIRAAALRLVERTR